MSRIPLQTTLKMIRKFPEPIVERSRKSEKNRKSVKMHTWQSGTEVRVRRIHLHQANLNKWLCLLAITVATTSFFVPNQGFPIIKERASPVGIFATSGRTVHCSDRPDKPNQGFKADKHTVVEDKYIVNSTNDRVDALYQDVAWETEDRYDFEQQQSEMSVKSRLKVNIGFWREIGASKFILDIIENGYKIPFVTTPSDTELGNNFSALNNKEFVDIAIKELESKNLIVRCDTKPLVVNPLSVSVQSSGKKRLILDLRVINSHILKQSIKYDDLRTALTFIQKSGWMIKFDIHAAFHSVEIYPPHTNFLGFTWTFDNTKVYFKFLVLPFGISSAPYVFTKLTRPLVKKWRGAGFQVLMYLDDGFCHNADNKLLYTQSNIIRHDLISSGFIPNEEKSVWVPVQNLIFLGVNLNTASGVMNIPEERLNKVRICLADIMKDTLVPRPVHIKKLARFVGCIISMHIVVGNVTQLMTKYLSICIASASSWNDRLLLDDNCIQQLQFWDSNLDYVNSRSITYAPQCQRVVYSDASQTGYGGYCVETSVGVAQGNWYESESRESSTWREITAVYRVLLSLAHVLQGTRVKWFSDNQSVVTIVEKGSMKRSLQDIALHIFHVLMVNGISIEMQWIPRDQNACADYISRIVDFDDWGISDTVFRHLNSIWGNSEVDWFASWHNKKLEIFYSRYWNPGSSGVDAFSFHWGGVNGWFVPPVYLITRVIRYMQICKAYGILIIPFWKSARFWPIICPDGINFLPGVKASMFLKTDKQYYTPSKSGTGIFGTMDLLFPVIALRIDFR